jgi:hypothetical protein
MILRLRQLCCHPHLILDQAQEFDDPSLMLASEADKEVGRAAKAMGIAWVTALKKRLLDKKVAFESIFSREDEAEEDGGDTGECGGCGEREWSFC